MKEDRLERLFAAVRRAGDDEFASVPAGFAESVLRRHQLRLDENRLFFRASVLSIATALVVFGAILGANLESIGYPGTEDQESTVEMAYALWDPAGN